MGDFAIRLKFESKAGNSGLRFRGDEAGSLDERTFSALIEPGHGAGGLHAFHGAGQFHAPGQSYAARQFRPGFHGYHGFYRGLYPYTLFGYPNYNSYWGYPYSLYEDDSPDCRFEWPKRTAKHKTVQRGVWICS